MQEEFYIDDKIFADAKKAMDIWNSRATGISVFKDVSEYIESAVNYYNSLMLQPKANHGPV